MKYLYPNWQCLLCGEPKQQAERAEFMDLVMEDAKFFKFTSIKAREERERLQGIHHKVHQKAQASRFDPKGHNNEWDCSNQQK